VERKKNEGKVKYYVNKTAIVNEKNKFVPVFFAEFFILFLEES